ncbi:hypothetical protein CMsap09_12265 [Clavibacter michiganensis]|uniref:Uncharacterized protein n=1 Tax=Clavibacter michiganensis TaxID=28447 RepID=A0A251XWT7_9MICO|nr:hypothetical protein CMsap09_12265 [Clavibacter michiganensis]
MGGIALPVGLVLALVTLACLLVAFRLVLVDRLHALCLGLGTVAAVAVLGTRGPSGSVLFPDDGLSQVWSLAPALLVAAVVVWPRFSTRPPAAGTGSDAAPGAGPGDAAPAGAGPRAA